ncbi:MAG: transglycosylase domain-containing protein [bacterium]|nr:transglycosylase domain-containing protein [bacterium]
MRISRLQKVIAMYLALLPLLALAGVSGWDAIQSWRLDRASVGSLDFVRIDPRKGDGGSGSVYEEDGEGGKDGESGERRLVLMTGRGPWVGAPAGRPYMPATQIPPELKQALLYQEDQAFYSHSGYSPREVYIVLRDYLLRGHRLRGASTLTQQLARTIFLNSERSLRRKLLEFRIARVLEQRLSKDRILELYLNHVYWGGESRGVVEAARAFFPGRAGPENKREPAQAVAALARLDAREFAFLVALLPNPNVCAPAPGGGIEHCRHRGLQRRMTRIIRHLERQRSSRGNLP